MNHRDWELTSPYTRTPQRFIMMIGTMNTVYQTAGLTLGFQNSISVAAALSSAGPVTVIMYPICIHVPVSLGFLRQCKVRCNQVLLTIIPACSGTYGWLDELSSVPDKTSRHGHEGSKFSDAQGYRSCQKAHENVSDQSSHGSSNCQCIAGGKEETCSLRTTCMISMMFLEELGQIMSTLTIIPARPIMLICLLDSSLLMPVGAFSTIPVSWEAVELWSSSTCGNFCASIFADAMCQLSLLDPTLDRGHSRVVWQKPEDLSAALCSF